MTLRPSLIGIALVIFALAAASAQAKPVDAFLISPGKGIGHIQLGTYLNGIPLPDPDISDPGMNQDHMVWVTKSKTGEVVNTLYMHTFNNAVLDNGGPGETVDDIRVTSATFHTASGLSTGSTLAQIHAAYPHAAQSDPASTVFEDDRRGIAFEFATAKPSDSSQCIAITVMPKGDSTGADADMVRMLLGEGP